MPSRSPDQTRIWRVWLSNQPILLQVATIREAGFKIPIKSASRCALPSPSYLRVFFTLLSPCIFILSSCIFYTRVFLHSVPCFLKATRASVLSVLLLALVVPRLLEFLSNPLLPQPASVSFSLLLIQMIRFEIASR